ncbi:protein kinase C delta type-like [Ranitomeya variabilis]|uniref:protein kinase C delta type-like n=1 Tax=Ranitomeya variabilis TaxID=490064 RepID=UPI004055D0C9
MATTGRGEKSKKRSEENRKREEKRKREEESDTTDGFRKKRREEKREETRKREEKKREKRKREEVSITTAGFRKKRREAEDNGLEDGEPTPGCSRDTGTSSPYARLDMTNFAFHKVLGRGSFGKVVLTSVPSRNIYMAVKMIKKREDNENIIMRERRILLAARDCPFLCHLYAAHQSRKRAYFIMEYLSGGSLKALIEMYGSLNIDNVRFYTAEIVCGLQFLHGHNIVHRDIKPDNIMLDADGHIRIIDLGLAQDGVTSSNNISGETGTFHFMAPEVLRKRGYGTAVDWWSLGIVVSQMATGHSPFYTGSVSKMAYRAITKGEPEIPSWLDADMQDLIKKLLCKKPQKRLGVCGNIREHPFFTTIGWEDLEERRAKPPFIPFRPVLEKHLMQWPEEKKALNPMAGFNYVSPSWARLMRRSGL